MVTTATPIRTEVYYPQSDGKPMADNTKQFRWIELLYSGLAGTYRDAADVFVSGNQFWYPVQGEPTIVQAPDVYVVFGRPKGDRPSYKQWEEGGVPMTVVFEVLSPENDYAEMIDKQMWYEEYGVEEYYVYDPDKNTLVAHLRRGEMLLPVRFDKEFVSSRMKVRFDLSGPEMTVFGPDGRRFLTPQEIAAELQSAQRLAELSRKLLAGQASDEEKQELARLAAPPAS